MAEVTEKKSDGEDMVTTMEFLSETDEEITFKVGSKPYSEVAAMKCRRLIRTENYLTFLFDDTISNINDIPETLQIEEGGEIIYYISNYPENLLCLDGEYAGGWIGE